MILVRKRKVCFSYKANKKIINMTDTAKEENSNTILEYEDIQERENQQKKWYLSSST